jgi:DNA-binding NarL/FixJ family response regulator
MMSNIRVVLVDDHPIVLAGLTALIRSAPEMELVGEATSGMAAIALIRRTKPDVAVVDISIPEMTGLEVARQVVIEQPAIKVLVLTLYDESVYVQQALEAGVHGYLVKRSAADELIRAIRAIAAEGIYLDSAIAGKALNRTVACAVSAHRTLSDRETEVIKLVALGFSNKQIAGRLALSIKTAETYKSRAAEKLGLRTRADIVRYGILRGWLHNI